MMRRHFPHAKCWWISSDQPQEPTSVKHSQVPESVIRQYASAKPLRRRLPPPPERPVPPPESPRENT
jgi:hypothetical protein